MAGTTTEMSKIKQLLRYLREGNVSNRKIARIVGLNKETVNNYARKAREDSMTIDELLGLDDPELEHRFKGGSPAYPEQARFAEFQRWLPRLTEEMSRAKKTHVTLKLLYEEYRKEAEYPYSLTQFRYHYSQNVKATLRKTSTVLKDLYEPGLIVYLDYAGDKMEYVDMTTGEIVRAEIFVASSPFSDYIFVIAVPSQSADDFAYALIEMFKAFGGVHRILVPDNLKAAVSKADRFAPSLNSLLEDMANHYGCVVEPARSRHPRDKALVENSVKLVYQRVYAPLRNRLFHSLHELNEAIRERVRAHNQKRMTNHDHTREECFLANEKPLLMPLPKEDYEVKRVHDVTVPDSCLVYLATYKAYFSVPSQYVGQRVKAVVTRSKVKIYASGQCVATHIRDGRKYCYDESHFPQKSQAWRGRSRQTFTDSARRIHPMLGDYIDKVFDRCGTVEQAMYKTCDAILHLGRQTPPDVLRQAIEEASALGKYNYRLLADIVARISAGVLMESQSDRLSPPANHEGLRGPEAFK